MGRLRETPDTYVIVFTTQRQHIARADRTGVRHRPKSARRRKDNLRTSNTGLSIGSLERIIGIDLVSRCVRVHITHRD